MEEWVIPDVCHNECVDFNLSDDCSLAMTDYNSSVVDDVAEIVEIHDQSTHYSYSNTQVHHGWNLQLDNQLAIPPLTDPCYSPRSDVSPDNEKRKRKQNLSVRENDYLEFREVEASGVANNREKTGRTIPLNEIRNMNSPRPQECYMNMEQCISDRKMSIAYKISNSLEFDVQFTPYEEYDIMQRAAAFLMDVKPDMTHCKLPAVLANDSSAVSVIDLCDPMKEAVLQYTPPPVTYTITESSYTSSKDCILRPKLPIGTTLFKPDRKLVELVALAIDDSPDGVLQVQQVYNYLTLKYPYFVFLDKLSTNSWRSSIRHALYQKWFKKITVTDEKISNKGCFWMINKENSPKEWSLPTIPSINSIMQGNIESGHGADSFREFSRQLINLSPAQVFSLGTKDSTSSTSQQELMVKSAPPPPGRSRTRSQPITPSINEVRPTFTSRIQYPVIRNVYPRIRTKRLKPYQVMSPQQMAAWGADPSVPVVISTYPFLLPAPSTSSTSISPPPCQGQMPGPIIDCRPVPTAHMSAVNSYTYASPQSSASQSTASSL